MKNNASEILKNYILHEQSVVIMMSKELLTQTKDELQILLKNKTEISPTQLKLVGALAESLSFYTTQGRNLLMLLNSCFEKDELDIKGMNNFEELLQSNSVVYLDISEQLTKILHIISK